MNTFLAGCLALIAALSGGQRCRPIAYASQDAPRRVAKDFSYPEAPETVRVETPFAANSLAGKITGPDGAGLERVLVERLGPGWGKRLDAAFTDPEGTFSLPGGSDRVQYLKLSKPGFNTLLMKVVVRKKPKAPLDVKLALSQ